jgi:hypothetical protein
MTPAVRRSALGIRFTGKQMNELRKVWEDMAGMTWRIPRPVDKRRGSTQCMSWVEEYPDATDIRQISHKM